MHTRGCGYVLSRFWNRDGVGASGRGCLPRGTPGAGTAASGTALLTHSRSISASKRDDGLGGSPPRAMTAARRRGAHRSTRSARSNHSTHSTLSTRSTRSTRSARSAHRVRVTNRRGWDDCNQAGIVNVNVNVNNLLAISESDFDNSGEPGPQALDWLACMGESSHGSVRMHTVHACGLPS